MKYVDAHLGEEGKTGRQGGLKFGLPFLMSYLGLGGNRNTDKISPKDNNEMKTGADVDLH